MFRIKLHPHIERIISVFHRLGIWNHGDEETVDGKRMKFLYFIYDFLLFTSLITGAVASDKRSEKIFLCEVALLAIVSFVKVWYLFWRKEEIMELLNRICVYFIDYRDIFNLINKKLENFMTFVAALLSFIYLGGVLCTLIAPFIGSERKLFYSIGFPLDWRNNEFAYLLAVAFLFIAMLVVSVAWPFNAIIWYLMANCGLRYEVLGEQIKNMGAVTEPINETAEGRNISVTERDNLYYCDLLEAIESHKYLKEYASSVENILLISHFSFAFFYQVNKPIGFLSFQRICGSISN